MIDTPAPVIGTRSSPVTIRALNEGQVLIDGEFARSPVSVAGQWLVIEGFNAKNAGPSGTAPAAGQAVVGVKSFTNSGNITFRRFVAWDARIDRNNGVCAAHQNPGPFIFEDFACFGTGRSTFITSQNGNNVTARRGWIENQGTTYGGAKALSSRYRHINMKLENVIISYDGNSIPETYGTATNIGGQFENFQESNYRWHATLGILQNDAGWSITQCSGIEIRGVLIYIRSTGSAFPHDGGAANMRGGPDKLIRQGPVSPNEEANVGCIDIFDLFTIIEPGHPRFSDMWGAWLNHTPNNNPKGSQGQIVNHITTVTGGKSGNPATFATSWDISNYFTGTTLASVPNPWTISTGANLCFRYVNGAKTTEPLWPWPMNQRIKNATGSAGAYRGPCNVNCVGGRFARVAVDVTAEVERLLGRIPAACRKP